MQQYQNNSYAPGDVVDNHILTSDGRWVPVAPAGPMTALAPHPASVSAYGALPAPSIEAEVNRRMASVKTTAWLLWLFLGGFNAHLAFIYPKKRAVIIVGSIALFVLTLGMAGLFSLVSWAFLLGDHAFDQLRAQKREDVQREFVMSGAYAAMRG